MYYSEFTCVPANNMLGYQQYLVEYSSGTGLANEMLEIITWQMFYCVKLSSLHVNKYIVHNQCSLANKQHIVHTIINKMR
jgi:hypothetical protein